MRPPGAIRFLPALFFMLFFSCAFSCSKVAHLMPRAHTGGQVYNQGVRYYTTKPMNGGTTFKCTFCEHTVTTLAFNVTNGNRRTQAAAEINQHAALLHLRAPLPKLTVRSAF